MRVRISSWQSMWSKGVVRCAQPEEIMQFVEGFYMPEGSNVHREPVRV
jgi:hypothetical protein